MISVLESNKSNEEIPTYLGCLPKVNQCFLLQRYLNHFDSTRDGWIGHHSRSYKPKNTPLTVFYKNVMFGHPKKKPNKEFMKREYFLTEDDGIVLVVYYGDPTKFLHEPHGNSRRDEPFNSTLPSTLQLIKDEHNYGSVIESYNHVKKDICRSSKPKNEEQADFIERHGVPRDSKQLKNLRQLTVRRSTLHHCEMMSIHILANSESQTTIRQNQQDPEFIAVFAHPSALELAKRILQHSVKHSDVLQVINYDRTFGITKYYVSMMTMKNIELSGHPAFPVMFLIHDRWHRQVHTRFWRDHVLGDLKIPFSVPIVTDREESIISALKSNNLTDNLLLCSNHLLRDVRFWLQ